MSDVFTPATDIEVNVTAVVVADDDVTTAAVTDVDVIAVAVTSATVPADDVTAVALIAAALTFANGLPTVEITFAQNCKKGQPLS